MTKRACIGSIVLAMIGLLIVTAWSMPLFARWPETVFFLLLAAWYIACCCFLISCAEAGEVERRDLVHLYCDAPNPGGVHLVQTRSLTEDTSNE